MGIVDYQKQEKTAVVTLNNGANQQDIAFAEGMLAALDEAEADKAVSALVITSSDEKNWSQGVNLSFLGDALQNGRHDDVRQFMTGMNKVFARLLTCPFPAIAAITGHAFGNGAILSCACDFRFMRQDRGYFCFPEVDLNIPFLPGMNAFIRKAVPQHLLYDLQLTGRRITADELAQHHVLVSAHADAASTVEAAMAFAAGFTKARPIFGTHKLRLHKHILEIMETEDKPIIEKLEVMV
ncbi:MAG: enoyl-CoA hydratase/isomerase family protein [Pseudomonadota bacterium]